MAPKRQNALDVCLALAENEGLTIPVKDHTIVPYFSGFFTLITTYFFGPLGFIAGGLIGYLVCLFLLRNTTKLASEILCESIAGSLIMIGGTFTFGLLLGKRGLYIGAIISLLFICIYSLPQFRLSKNIIESEMSPEEKLKLGRQAQNILSSLDINDVSLLMLIVSKCPELKRALVNRINSVVRKNQMLKQKMKMQSYERS